MNLFLYSLTVIIWGTTWIAITFQHGLVETVVSIFYRFALAGVLLFLTLLILGKLQKIRPIDHFWCFMQGACLFCFNFICFYTASHYLASGLISVVFSIAIFFNAINSRLFWRVSPTKSTYTAALLGIIGLMCLFWQELNSAQASKEFFIGLGLCIMGTYCFSLGNMISVRHGKAQVNTLTSTAYGMNYGAIILLVIISLRQTPIAWDNSQEYMLSLLYLAIPGSVIGFTAYLSLVKRIGADQAAYATVLFPVIALAISSVYENYQWGWLNSTGLILVLLGNAVALNLFGQLRLQNRVQQS